MANLTQTPAQVQADLDAVEASNVGLDSLTDGSDTQATALKKSGFFGLAASTTDAPTTDRAVMLTIARDVDAVGEIRHAQVVITEPGNAYFVVDDGGTLGTWSQIATTAGSQTLTNKVLTSPDINTPDIDGGTIDGTVIGGSSAAAGSFTTLAASGATTLSSTLGVTGAATFDASVIVEAIPSSSVEGWAVQANGPNGYFVGSGAAIATAFTHAEYYNPNGTVGSISTNGSATSFNTSSDPRLKSEFVTIDDALAAQMVKDAVENKWVGVFKFKADDSEPVAGYNAHALIDNQLGYGGSEGQGPRDAELGSVVDGVTVTPAGVDQSKRVPLLEAALYNALKRIKALEAK